MNPSQIMRDYLAALVWMKANQVGAADIAALGPEPPQSNFPVPEEQKGQVPFLVLTMPEEQWESYRLVTRTVTGLNLLCEGEGDFLLSVAVHQTTKGTFDGYKFAGIKALHWRKARAYRQKQRRYQREQTQLALMLAQAIITWEGALMQVVKQAA